MSAIHIPSGKLLDSWVRLLTLSSVVRVFTTALFEQRQTPQHQLAGSAEFAVV